jgi:hypothetical protein
MADDPNECREQTERYRPTVPELLRSLQKIQQTFHEWISRRSCDYSCSVILASLAIAFELFDLDTLRRDPDPEELSFLVQSESCRVTRFLSSSILRFVASSSVHLKMHGRN